jgi:hypothetical protein
MGITVNAKLLLVFTGLLVTPPCIAAEAGDAARFTDKDQIEFAPSSKLAFDRSGSDVSHLFLTGGVMLAEHNGTIGNVTVARLGADGRVETFCTTSETAAKAWLAGEDRAAPSHELHLAGEQNR